MKAVGYRRALRIDEPEALLDVIVPEPMPRPQDLVVDIKAISVNPVDTKVRQSTEPPDGEPKILGWDASGVVRAVGPDVTLFQPGDSVWYAGSIARPGTNAQTHVVDERIVGKMPATLTFAEAAALPLTTITAWELLFDRLDVLGRPTAAGKELLVIGAPGGVGSILLQLARKLTDLTIVATASNPESEAWVLARGAHHTIDHRKPLGEELRRIGIPSVAHVASLTQTEKHFAQIVDALAPEGRLAVIDDRRLLAM